jgi:type II secretory pathway pseudopilin PulG
VFTIKQNRNHAGGGFSVLELMIVVTIALVVGAMAAPTILTYTNNYRLKSSASELAGLIQLCRINAVRRNSAMAVQSRMVNGRQQVWVDLDGDAQFNAGEPMLLMPTNVTLQSSGYPGDAGTVLTSNVQPVPAWFNARGIPCRINGGSCPTDGGSVGFVYYLRNESRGGVYNWGAVRINPVGRITAVIWSGSSYQ